MSLNNLCGRRSRLSGSRSLRVHFNEKSFKRVVAHSKTGFTVYEYAVLYRKWGKIANASHIKILDFLTASNKFVYLNYDKNIFLIIIITVCSYGVLQMNLGLV